MTVPNESSRLERSPFNWHLFLMLMGMGALGLIAIVPYSLTAAELDFTPEQLGPLVIQFVPQILFLVVQIVLGLRIGPGIGLGVPLLSRWLQRESVGSGWRVLLHSALVGAIAGGLTVALDQLVFAPQLEVEFQALGVPLPNNPNPPAWQGFLASFYGGINEEILTRLFLLTLMAWLGGKLWHTEDGRPVPAILWLSTLFAGLAFGLGHLPTAAAMGIPLIPLFVGRTIVLNLSGVLFGWLYWKHGLESAMVAHFSVDILLHVVGALLVAA